MTHHFCALSALLFSVSRGEISYALMACLAALFGAFGAFHQEQWAPLASGKSADLGICWGGPDGHRPTHQKKCSFVPSHPSASAVCVAPSGAIQFFADLSRHGIHANNAHHAGRRAWCVLALWVW